MTVTTDTVEEENAPGLKTLTALEKSHIDSAKSRHDKAFSKYEEERYRWAQVVKALYQAEYDITDYLPEDQEDKFFDWMSDYELRKAQETAVARERFATANAIREAKRQRRAARK